VNKADQNLQVDTSTLFNHVRRENRRESNERTKRAGMEASFIRIT